MKAYWIAWLVLLGLTLGMVAMGSSGLSRAGLVVLLVSAMLAKATVIGGWFMHLRQERATLVVMVAAGILLTGALLFVLIAPDGAGAGP